MNAIGRNRMCDDMYTTCIGISSWFIGLYEAIGIVGMKYPCDVVCSQISILTVNQYHPEYIYAIAVYQMSLDGI